VSRRQPTGGARAALAGLGESLGAVVLATGAVALLEDVSPVAGLAVLYLLAVLLVAIRRGELAALATAVLSVLLFNYLFIEPRHRLTIADPRNVVALAVFLVAAVVVGRLAAAARQRAAEAEERAQEAAAREREAELVAQAARSVLSGSGVESRLQNLGASVAAATGAASSRVELASAPAPADREVAVRLPTVIRPAWLYVSEDVRWERGALDRMAVPLAGLIDVALERERLDARAAEAEATRRAEVAKTAILRAISHDLRSPLTAITTAADALSGDRLADSDREDLVAVLREESARLAGLVDDLLDLSRVEAGAVNPQPDWCDVREVVYRAAAQARSRHGERRVEVSLPELPLVEADAKQLERVFSNLLDNAIRVSAAGEPVRVTGGVGGGRVTVRVIDRGPGIPAGQRQRVFEPFFRGRQTGGGSGLGLAISRGFVEANGGQILLQTGTEEGTAFAVSFPLVPQPATVT
jgi:two-component system, OmpR family, sensor histidine kinase KdpD